MEDLVLITPAAYEPVTVDEFKSHAHLTSSRFDSYIASILIPAARSAVEDELKRVLVTQTWRLKLDGFPGKDPRYEASGYPEILVPKPPFQSVVSFQYYDSAGVLQTLRECNPDGTTQGDDFYGYRMMPGSETQPARLNPPWARPWPPNRRMIGAVLLEFVAGYGAPSGSPVDITDWTPNPIPPKLKLAVLHVGAFLYDNRWGDRDTDAGKISKGITNLLAGYHNYIA